MFDPTRGVSRACSSFDKSRDRSAAARGAGGARPCGDSFARGSGGTLEHEETRRAAQWLLARPAPAPRERNGADAGTNWNQLNVIESSTCRRARRRLSVVLDGEASATEQAEAARHLAGCEDCSRFAALVAELKHCLRAASVETPEALRR
jgi:putative zinc finger protein